MEALINDLNEFSIINIFGMVLWLIGVILWIVALVSRKGDRMKMCLIPIVVGNILLLI